MFKKIIFYALVLGHVSCFNSDTEDINTPAVIDPIDTSALLLKQGDFLLINLDSIALSGIVLSFSKEEGEIWYGICFADVQGNGINDLNPAEIKLFGRQVPDADGSCHDGFDLTFLNEKGVTADIQVLKNFPVNFSESDIHARDPETSLQGIYQSYLRGKSQREKPQTPCNTGLLSTDAVRERYFSMDKVLK